MLWTILQLLILLGFPFVSRRLERLHLLPAWLSPVVLCYAIGIILSNLTPFPLDEALSEHASEAAIVIAIPLLLFGTNLKLWFRQARSSLISFGLCVFSGVLASALAAYFLRHQIDNTWQLAGMFTGIYTGGTPNMQAIGIALDASQETIILVAAADVFWGGIYLLLLTSVAPKIYQYLLPFPQQHETSVTTEAVNPIDTPYPINFRDALKAIGLSVMVILIAVAVTYLFFGNLKQVSFLILMLTSLSILASSSAHIRNLENTFETGEYFLLIFCVALGMLADFSAIVSSGMPLLLFMGGVMWLTIILHTLLARQFNINRDVYLFTSVAALYGPAFIGQIASTLKNRDLIFAGMAMGLLGYAIGNYLGIGLAYLLRALIM
jgi:uncharacterized membrane protein